MSKRKYKPSQTGQYKAIEDEPRIFHETERPSTLPEFPDSTGSATGILRTYQEGADDMADQDEDQPAEQG